jgi:hypothetical protein
MHFPLWPLLAASYASATALTYKLNANEKACFFTDVRQQNAKIAFYFAVSFSSLSLKSMEAIAAME